MKPVLIFIRKYYELIFTAIVIYFIFVIAYIKVKYPFWSLQPIFHKYDFWRYFKHKHVIITDKNRLLNRFYNDSIKTIKYQDLDEDDINGFVDFIHCNYIESDRVIMTANKKNFDSYFTGLTKSSFVSILKEKDLISTIVSRPLHLFHNDIKHEIYYIDMVCMKRDTKKCETLVLELFHTHLYNQMSIESKTKSFIFKKEIELIEELVPLIKFTSYLFHINKPFIKSISLPLKIFCTKISQVNFHLYKDFVNTVSKNNTCMIPDISSVLTLINNKEYFVYSLLNGNDILAFYFFKNTHIQYEEYDTDVFQFVSSYNNTKTIDLFFDGFIKSIQMLNEENHIDLIIFDNISHNTMIMNKMLDKHHIIFQHDCAYYLYNTLIPNMPLKNENCLCLI